MANIDRPTGFRFAKNLTGTPVSAMIRKYQAADRSADTTNDHGDIYIGDPVALSSGLVVPANSGDTILGVAVAFGATGDTTFGDEGYFNASNLEQRYLPHTATTGIVAVMPAEGNLFEAQTAADLDLVAGSNADISTDAAEAHGSQTTGKSTAELVTSVNADVIVVEDVTTPDNDVTLTNARHLVMFTTTTNAQ